MRYSFLLSFFLHVGFLLPFLFFSSKCPPKKISIQSISERSFIAVETSKQPPLSPAKIEKAIAIPKQPPEPREKVEKPIKDAPRPKPHQETSKSKPVVKKESCKPTQTSEVSSENRKEALKELIKAQELASSTPTLSASFKHSPQMIQLESELTVNETKYEALLMTFLQDNLTLPEKGFVKVKLQFNSNGRFLSLRILESSSQSNRDYIERALSVLTFPSFEGEKQKSFQLLLENR